MGAAAIARWNQHFLLESGESQTMLLFIPLFHALFFFSKVAAIPDHAVRISISSDDEFKLFADNEIIGMGDHHDEVYKFYTELEHGSHLQVEAVDIHAESGFNPRSLRGIILSTSQGLVTNAEWRCIEKNGSLLPDVSDWPFAEILDNNDDNSEWGMRPEILPNASWIWAQKLSSGDNPSKVACVPPPRVARCDDNGCEGAFDKQGVTIRISADSDFKLFADETNETIGMGDDHEEEYEFFTELEHGSKLRVEAVDKHAESGLNPRSHRGIILSTSQGLVTNPEWRCIENNGSLLPDVSDWPFAEILGNNSASFEWGVRPEILPNASWIWAQKLSSGDYPSKVVCVPAPIPANEAAIPDQPVVISISADDEFELFADETNELIGKGNHYKEVYKFKFKTEFKHGSKLRVEAMELHPGSPRGIILSTSQGLVTNAEWRCIENNGSLVPDISDWPFAEMLGNNSANSQWDMRPEILPNASRIWAQKLSSGDYPSKVACVPAPSSAKCVDNG